MNFVQRNLFVMAGLILSTASVCALESDLTCWSKGTDYIIPTDDPRGLWFGDFNQDGYKDILIRHNNVGGQNGKISLFLSFHNGYQSAVTIDSPYEVFWEAVVADFNDDDALDFAFTHSDGQPPATNDSNEISIYLNNNSTITTPFSNAPLLYSSGDSSTFTYTYNLDAGKIDGDDYNDIVVSSAGDNSFSVLLNIAPGGSFVITNESPYQTENTHIGAHTHDIKLADLNNDNNLDVVVIGTHKFDTIHVYLGDGTGRFSSPTTHWYDPSAGFKRIYIADFKKDGYPDLVVPAGGWAYTGFSTYILDNKPAFSAGSPIQLESRLIESDYATRKILDWNCDGYPDFVASNSGNSSPIIQDNYAIYLNDGTGNLSREDNLIKNSPDTTNDFFYKDFYEQFVDLDNDGAYEFVRISPDEPKLTIYSQCGHPCRNSCKIATTASEQSAIRLINISSRAGISGGAYDMFGGFMIEGTGQQTVLVRGIAVDEGVDPAIKVLNNSTKVEIAANDNWDDDATQAAAISALPPQYQLPDRNGNDAGLILSLPAGVYDVQLSSNAAHGLALIGVDAVD